MRKIMEKIAVLSLSLMLVSAFSVSAALPEMQKHFSGHPREQVEMLISVTSFAVMVTIALDAWLCRYMRERISIVCGILLMVAGGVTPVFVQEYVPVLLTRILLGIGIGMINARAINIINERYEGDERAALLGFRGSAEVLGNAVLTLIAGRLLLLRWNYAFGVYLTGLPILLIYLLFIPARPENEAAPAERGVAPENEASPAERGAAPENEAFSAERGAAPENEASPAERGAVPKNDAAPAERGVASENEAAPAERKVRLGREQLREVLFLTCFAGLVICVNCSNTMRLPSLVLEKGYGTETDASVVLSLMLAVGIAAGVLFGRLEKLLGEGLMVFGMFLFGVGMAVMAYAANLPVLGIGAVFAGAAYSVLTTCVFYKIGAELPKYMVNTGTSVVLVGCNLGAALSPMVLKCIDAFGESMTASFLVYAAVMAILGVIYFFLIKKAGAAGKAHE